jgi:hypothetical protein
MPEVRQTVPERVGRAWGASLQVTWFGAADELQVAEDERRAMDDLRRYLETAP